jgi:hypothetical protein
MASFSNRDIFFELSGILDIYVWCESFPVFCAVVYIIYDNIYDEEDDGFFFLLRSLHIQLRSVWFYELRYIKKKDLAWGRKKNVLSLFCSFWYPAIYNRIGNNKKKLLYDKILKNDKMLLIRLALFSQAEKYWKL